MEAPLRKDSLKRKRPAKTRVMSLALETLENNLKETEST